MDNNLVVRVYHVVWAWFTSLLVLILLVACGDATPLSFTATPTLMPEPTHTPSATADAQSGLPSTAKDYPLAIPGPYAMSRRRYTFEDADRDNRKVSITVWYPAVLEKPSEIPLMVGANLEPAVEGAPFPLILSSTEMAMTLARYVVSHGFVWVSINDIHSYARMNDQMTNQPLDILFALNKAGSGALTELEGVIDADRTGVIGYSFDGYNTLALSGARIDPAYYLAQCPEPDSITAGILGEKELSAYNCEPADDWETFTAKIPDWIQSSEDGLWQPMTDPRIRAVMPLAGDGWWLFGEKGLAAVDIPVLMITATEDSLYAENALIYQHLGTADKTFISFVGLDHMMIFNPDQIVRLAHFANAFFGYHLQGRAEYAEFYSEAFVAQIDDLAWGVVK